MTRSHDEMSSDEQSQDASRSKRRRRRSSRGRRKSIFGQFILLLWKSLLLRRYHWFLTACEIILPIFLFSLLIIIRLSPYSSFAPYFVNYTFVDYPRNEQDMKRDYCYEFGNYDYENNSCLLNLPDTDYVLFHGPKASPFTKDIADYLANEIGLRQEGLIAVEDLESMDEVIRQMQDELIDRKLEIMLGLYVEGLNTSTTDLPQDFRYTLRLGGYWSTSKQYPVFQPSGPGWEYQYRHRGFVYLQSLIDRFFISQVTENQSYSTNYKIETQDYPYPPYINNSGMTFIFQMIIPTFLVVSMILISPSLIKGVVQEKATGVRELICLMGMHRWLLWVGWFLYSFLPVILIVSVATLFMSISTVNNIGEYLPPILPKTDPSFTWVFLLLYGSASICFCLLITAFFNRPTLATTIGILAIALSYYIPNTAMYNYDQLSFGAKLSSCLLPNMAAVWGFKVIEMFENKLIGVQWSNLWETSSPSDDLCAGIPLVMLVIDIVIYLLLALYVYQINPGTYGVPLPWYFPLQRSYWCVQQPTENEYTTGSKRHQTDNNMEYFEAEPQGLKPGIVIKNLRKEFRSPFGETKVAVENVSMICYEGQCTVLLGHNGAGKTTTMSVLTGVYAPTRGSAQVGGWDISTNLSQAREEIGLCPQHNMLFTELTVLQHLLFFGRLKGLSARRARKEALQILEKLELLDKQNMFGNQLSGGMKRKLSLAISLAGGSKVVILDEPSSGLDPESRRWVWNVVQGERGKRTFLITTHHMEEADVLGDRVAIMASGRVVCAGSTLFLKNKFGDGYTLEMMLSDDTKIEGIKSVVQHHMPTSTMHLFNSGELSFKLPPDTAKFAPLLDDLTAQKDRLALKHVGLSLTTMERVFLKVGEISERKSAYDNKSFEGTPGTVNGFHSDRNTSAKGYAHAGDNDTKGYNGNDLSSDDTKFIDSARLRGPHLFLQRLRGFLIKRMIYTKRKWALLIAQILLPVIVTLLCIAVDHTIHIAWRTEEPLTLTLSNYLFTRSHVAHDTPNEELAAAYSTLFADENQVFPSNNITASLLEAANEDLRIYRENDVASAFFYTNEDDVNIMRILAQPIALHSYGVSTSLVGNALLRYATNSSDYSITTTNYPLPRGSEISVETDISVTAFLYSGMMPIALAMLSASFLVYPLQERVSKAKQIQVMTGAPTWLLWTINFLWDYLTYSISALLMFGFLLGFDPNGFFNQDSAPGALILLLLLYGWGSIPMAYVFSFPFDTSASGFSVMSLVNIITGIMLSTVVIMLDYSMAPRLQRIGIILKWISSFIPAFPASMGLWHLLYISQNNTQCDMFNTEAFRNACQIAAGVGLHDPLLRCCPECVNLSYVDCFEKTSYLSFSKEGMAPDVLTLAVNGVIFIAIIILIEYGVFRSLQQSLIKIYRKIRPVICRVKCCCSCCSCCSCCRSKTSSEENTDHFNQLPKDEDVIAEENLINELVNLREENGAPLETANISLLVNGLSKQYFGSKVKAVDTISFRVKRGECLGLLGVNGAGKTTTFNMLTGDEPPTAGDAWIDGTSLRHNSNTFQQNIGYCPQFDAIIGEFTGIEMLMLLGRLRGVPDKQLRPLVQNLVSLVDLSECAGRRCSTYSGGNKRKLSTALALVGSPPLVFLDEPTSGVDPASRRRVWTAVTQAVNNGQSVVLTSHSMEECEALCSRIVIMSRGSLRCLGTTTHLKAKFGQGYSLQIKLNTNLLNLSDSDDDGKIYEAKVIELRDLIWHHLPGSVLTDQHKGMLAYRVPNTMTWGHLFNVMEALKAGQDPESRNTVSGSPVSASTSSSIIEDYAASDTSLEQVFIAFAREANARDQEEADYPVAVSVIGNKNSNSHGSNSISSVETSSQEYSPRTHRQTNSTSYENGSCLVTEL